MLDRIRTWLDERTGSDESLKTLGEAPQRGGASWSRVLGMMLVALLVLEFATGIAMAFYYSPSTTDAWASVHYFENEVAMGALVRSLHHWGMDALIVVALLHLVVTFVKGSYKKPREVTWLLGLLTLLLLVGFSITGFILAYDAKGLAANQVETQIMNSMPLIGPLQRELLIGGNDYGNLSLTRFYALHALVLPLLLVGLVVAHIRLARRHGPTPGWWLSKEAADARTVPYWPNQAVRDALGALVCIAIVVGIAASQGAPLHAPADPSGSFDARPEWYFMPLFQLRKVFTGSSELIATVLIPGVGLAFLAAVPFLDRKKARHPMRRTLVMGPFVFGILGGAMLAVTGLVADRNNEAHQEAMAEADEKAERAKALAAMGGVPLDPSRLIENDPQAWGESLFGEHCASCHSLGDGSGTSADLAGWGSRAWVERFLSDPNHPHLYGGTELACQMAGVDVYGIDEEEDVAALVNGIVSVRGDYAPSGLPDDTEARYAEVFDDGGCAACHRLEADGEEMGSVDSIGPDLTTYGSPEWIDTLLLFPDDSTHYGALNAMPSFAPTLDKAERAAVRTYLLSLADMPVAPDPDEDAFAEVSCDKPKDDEAEGAVEDVEEDTAVVVAADLPSWERGKAVFDSKCANCHIVGSVGEDIGPELTGWGSPAWVKGFMAEPDHERYYGGTDLEGNMPAVQDLGLDDEETIDLLTEAFLIRRNGTSPALEAAIAEDAIEAFDDASCGACHQFEIGDESVGSEDGDGPVLTGYASEAWLHGLLLEPGSPRYYGDDNAMPPFANLSEQEREDLTLFMMSLADLPH